MILADYASIISTYNTVPLDAHVHSTSITSPHIHSKTREYSACTCELFLQVYKSQNSLRANYSQATLTSSITACSVHHKCSDRTLRVVQSTRMHI